MTFLFDWTSLLFMGFVYVISSLVILYSDVYMFGDSNIIRFILLVLMCNVTEKYRVSIKSFPDYKRLLQVNYVEYKHMQL
jgi:hypothetical protein